MTVGMVMVEPKKMPTYMSSNSIADQHSLGWLEKPQAPQQGHAAPGGGKVVLCVFGVVGIK